MADPNSEIVRQELQKRGVPMTNENAMRMAEVLSKVMAGDTDPSINGGDGARKVNALFQQSDKPDEQAWMQGQMDKSMGIQSQALPPLQGGTAADAVDTNAAMPPELPSQSAPQPQQPAQAPTAEVTPPANPVVSTDPNAATQQPPTADGGSGWLNALIAAASGAGGIAAGRASMNQGAMPSPKIDPAMGKQPSVANEVSVDDQITKLIGADAAPKQLPAPQKQITDTKALPKPRYKVPAGTNKEASNADSESMKDVTPTAADKEKPRVAVNNDMPKYRTKTTGETRPVVKVKGKTIQVPEKMIQQLMRFAK